MIRKHFLRWSLRVLLIALLFFVVLNTNEDTPKPKQYLKVEVSSQLEGEYIPPKITDLYNFTSIPVYATGRFKSFMDGKAIVDTSSKAYSQLQKMQINENGIYAEENFVGVALAKFYGTVGDKFRVTLDSGEQFFAIMTDTKQDRHVDDTYADMNGAVIEFVVDICSLPQQAKISGSLDCVYSGRIVSIERMELKEN